MIVYRFTNKINEKIYIGITKDLNQRIEQHMHAESPLGEDIRKYGIDNFHIEILSACSTIGKAKELEKSWIEQLDCREPKGYNQSDGGEFPVATVSLIKIPKSMPKKMINLPDALKRFRKDFNLTQKAVADAVGMHEVAYNRYERGEREPAYKQLIKLADTYNVSIDYLVGRTNNPTMNR